MNATELLESLKQVGVRLVCHGDELCIRGPKHVMTEERLALIRSRKGDLISILSQPFTTDVLPEAQQHSKFPTGLCNVEDTRAYALSLPNHEVHRDVLHYVDTAQTHCSEKERAVSPGEKNEWGTNAADESEISDEIINTRSGIEAVSAAVLKNPDSHRLLPYLNLIEDAEKGLLSPVAAQCVLTIASDVLSLIMRSAARRRTERERKELCDLMGAIDGVAVFYEKQNRKPNK